MACEFSGTVRDAFTALGHEAMSCDLLPTESDGWHYQGDVFDVIDLGWDLMVAHPPWWGVGLPKSRPPQPRTVKGL